MVAVGADETKLTREALKWPYGEFEIPNEVYDAFGAAGKKGQALEDEWNKVNLSLYCPPFPLRFFRFLGPRGDQDLCKK